MLDAAAIKTRSGELGFDRCGIAPAADLPELEFLSDWLARGYGGSMTYLARSAHRRADVRHVLPSARSVIVTATNYNTDRPYSIECADPARAHIARYAWGDDYHDVILPRLEALVAWMREASDASFEARAYVDTGPVQERVYARHAGIGWIGKNTCVINPEIGSWIFLGVVICSLELDYDQPSIDQCGTCTLCLEVCPTQAFVAPGTLDSNRCISYLTIEHRGNVDAPLAAGIGSHVYGCDVCQEVCPWNATAPVSEDRAWAPRREWDGPALHELAERSEDEIHAGLRGSAMRRAKPAGLRRNIMRAMDNADRT
jgi:epoxyqueuosine reductase